MQNFVNFSQLLNIYLRDQLHCCVKQGGPTLQYIINNSNNNNSNNNNSIFNDKNFNHNNNSNNSKNNNKNIFNKNNNKTTTITNTVRLMSRLKQDTFEYGKCLETRKQQNPLLRQNCV